MIIAVNAAGGEYAPHEIVKGAVKAAQDFKIGIALVGKKEILHVQASHYMKNLDIFIVDADEIIEDAESPIEAVTKKQNSSIVVGTKWSRKARPELHLCGQYRRGTLCGTGDAGPDQGHRARHPGQRHARRHCTTQRRANAGLRRGPHQL
jgi:hypothetical protein